MTARRLRGAVVGAGQMGRFQARVVNELEETELIAIVDPDPGAERIAQVNGTRWLRSLDELLADETPDFVAVTVPTDRHAEVARAVIEAGAAVLIEKPIAATLDEAEALIALAGEHGLPLAVGHVERFNPAVRALDQKLRDGALGRVFQIHARRLSPFPIRIGDTGVAMDLATHDLDLMCVLAGEPVRITAETDRKAHRMNEDLVAALIRFDSGAVGVLEVNWLTPDKVRQLVVTGERGMFVVDYLNQHLTLYENAQASEAWDTIAIFEGVTEGNVTRFALPRVEPLRAQLEAFVLAVRGEAPVAVTGEDGLRAVRVALAVVEAGATGKPVEFRRGYDVAALRPVSPTPQSGAPKRRV
jgi:UDP-N-acetylglucosamine 3-dehydrogenase